MIYRTKNNFPLGRKLVVLLSLLGPHNVRFTRYTHTHLSLGSACIGLLWHVKTVMVKVTVLHRHVL